jgi:hypothetical protein
MQTLHGQIVHCLTGIVARWAVTQVRKKYFINVYWPKSTIFTGMVRQVNLNYEGCTYLLSRGLL